MTDEGMSFSLLFLFVTVIEAVELWRVLQLSGSKAEFSSAVVGTSGLGTVVALWTGTPPRLPQVVHTSHGTR
jgi:hypothetical protein